MRVVFMGTPRFAVPSLMWLARNHDVVATYTRPDAVSSRGTELRPSPAKIASDALGIEVRQPTSLRSASEIARLADLQADLIVVAAFGHILPQAVLDAARLGAVNVHASLLPRWRGAAPVQRAILAGDHETGVSIMRVEEGLDTGPFCLQERVIIGDTTADELSDQLAELGADALARALPAIVDGSAAWTPQDDAQATYANKIAKSDVGLSPALAPEEIARRVRASSSAAPARASIAAHGVTLLAVASSDVDLVPGTFATREGSLHLGAVGGSVEVLRLKPDGKNAMSAGAWVCGLRDAPSGSWGAPR